MSTADSKWIVCASQCVPGLGNGELLQSGFSSPGFLARIVLNSYESNCLRDWLAQRWKFSSLRRTTIAYSECNCLSISLQFKSSDLAASKLIFEAWLADVLADKAQLEQPGK